MILFYFILFFLHVSRPAWQFKKFICAKYFLFCISAQFSKNGAITMTGSFETLKKSSPYILLTLSPSPIIMYGGHSKVSMFFYNMHKLAKGCRIFMGFMISSHYDFLKI